MCLSALSQCRLMLFNRGVTPIEMNRLNLERCLRSVAAEDDLDVHAIGDLDPHELPESTLVRVKVDKPLVDAHLPPVVGLASLSVRRFPASYPEFLGRKGNGSTDCDSSPLGDSLDLVANSVHHGRVGAAERDSSTL